MTDKPKESKPRKLVGRLTGITHEYICGRMGGKQVAAELRAIADWIDGARPEPAEIEPRPPASTEIEDRIFAYWVQKFGKKGAKFTRDRRLKVRARLKEGYTERDIKLGIDGCAASNFHQGENPDGKAFDDLTLICRNGSKLEGFRDNAGAAPPTSENVVGLEIEERIQRLQREAEAALKEGRTSAYNAAQDAIRKLRKGSAGSKPRAASAGG